MGGENPVRHTASHSRDTPRAFCKEPGEGNPAFWNRVGGGGCPPPSSHTTGRTVPYPAVHDDRSLRFRVCH